MERVQASLRHREPQLRAEPRVGETGAETADAAQAGPEARAGGGVSEAALNRGGHLPI